jgi:hypothetical protein
VIEALFKGNPYNTDGKDESVKNMYERYRQIEQNDVLAGLDLALPHFCYWLMTKVGLIEIVTDSDEYAYAIFETMNDRGKPLSAVDMLKAYVLAPVEDAEQRRRANDIWKRQVLDLISWGRIYDSKRDESFIKAWFRAQFAETIRERRAGATDKDWERIGTVFHRWARENRTRLGLGTESENLAFMTSEFPFFAKAYQLILDASRSYTKGLEAVFYNSQNDFTWQYTVLLAPLLAGDDDETVRRKIAVTATFLDIWLMRRVVNYIRVGYSTMSYAMWLLCREIRKKSTDALVEIFSQKLADDDTTFEGSSARGRGGVRLLALNQFSRRYIFHLLARLTAFTEVGSGRADLFDTYVDRDARNSFDIEHIWEDKFSRHSANFSSPQEFQEWRDHVASLLLLPADVNRSLQDKPYCDKSPIYARQNFYAASLARSAYQHQPRFESFIAQQGLPFEPYDQFGKPEQSKRRELVAALCNLVWSPDRLIEAAR